MEKLDNLVSQIQMSLIVLALLTFVNSSSFAQDINTNPPNDPVSSHYFYVEPGQPIDLQFVYSGPTSGGETWGITDAGTNFIAETGATIDPTTGLLQCIIPESPGTFIYSYDVNFGAYSEVYNFGISRPGANVMLVLDISGSMGQSVASGSSDTKWDVLKSSVLNFLDAYRKWEITSPANPLTAGKVLGEDKIGVVFFNSNRTDFTPAGLNDFNPPPSLNDPLTEINTQMSSLSPGGTTCLGGGVIAAYQSFDWTSHRKKHIIVFSDGMQNRNPQYNEIENRIYKYGSALDGFLETEELDFMAVDLEEFKVHTVCIGDVALNALMQDLAVAHSNASYHGEYHGMISMEDLYIDMDDNFTALFTNTLEGFSPAIVNKSLLQIVDNTVSEKFNVNNSADRILIKAVGKNIGRNVKVEVEKDGIFFNNFVEYDGSFVRFFAKKDTVEAMGAKMGGEWIIRFSGEQGLRFSTTCIIEDEFIDYNCSLENSETEPGDVLQLKLEVSANGNPVTDLTMAKAFVLKPGEDINDLFANAALPDSLPKGWSSEPGNFAGQDKYERLIALDSAFVNSLKLVENEVNLINNDDGTYTGQFVNTEESGVYKIIFKFIGENATEGTFERYYMLSKVIDFGLADENNTTFEISSKFLSRSFVIKPVNKFGYLIGPNRLASISITMGGKKLELVDNLDGTYTTKVPLFTLFKRNAIVELNIKSQKYAETKYKDLKGASLGQDLLIDLGFIILILLIIILLLRWIIKKKN